MKIALTELNIEDDSNSFSRDLFFGALNITSSGVDEEVVQLLVPALKNL
jgi:hypothetical protein